MTETYRERFSKMLDAMALCTLPRSIGAYTKYMRLCESAESTYGCCAAGWLAYYAPGQVGYPAAWVNPTNVVKDFLGTTRGGPTPSDVFARNDYNPELSWKELAELLRTELLPKVPDEPIGAIDERYREILILRDSTSDQ